MTLNFPDSPSTGDIYDDSTSGFRYEWNGTVWISTDPARAANIKELDDISSGFNGSTTQFNLTVSSSAVSPVSDAQVLISVGGVMQNPTNDYTVSGSTITFTTAPSAGLTFFGVFLGQALSLNTIQDGTVTNTSFKAGTAGVGIQSGGVAIGVGITQINFIGIGNTLVSIGNTVNVSIASSTVGINTLNTSYFKDIVATGNLNVTGDLTYDEVTAVNQKISGVTTTTGLDVLGISSVKDLRSVGVTTLTTGSATNFTVTNLVGASVTATSLKAPVAFTTSLTAANVDVTGITTIRDDLTLKGASANITFDKSTDDLIWQDNAKATFGTGSDLQIYHDNGNSYVKHAGVGNLRIEAAGGADEDIILKAKDAIFLQPADGEDGISVAANGAVSLFYDDTKRVETTSVGMNVVGNVDCDSLNNAGISTFSGDVTFTGDAANVTWDKSTDDLIFNDNAQAKFGTGGDLSIYHDGTNNNVKSTNGHVNLYLPDTKSFSVGNSDFSEDMFRVTESGAVTLYYNGNSKLATTNDGTVTTGISTATGGLSINADSKNLTIGASEDLKLFHDGSHSIIHDDGTGALKFVSANSFQFRDTDKDTGDYCINANIDGAVSLYHNGHKSIETIGAGITIYGPEGGAGQICLSSDEGDDNADKWRITKEAGNDSFRIQNYKSGSWETNILATGDGAVELYNDNVKTLETHSTGVTILGPEGDSAILYLNADEGDDNADKWRLLSSSANPQLYLQNYKDGGWETSIQMDGGGQTMLAYNDAGKLQTTNDGVKITGIVTASAGVAYTGLLRESFAKTDGRLSANTNIDLEDGMVHYFTTAENTTSTPNIRWNSSTSLNNKMNINDAITVTIISAAAAAGYSAQMTIDGGGISEQWVGGEAPDEGGANGYDIYTYNILKTADATFFVIAHVVNAT